MQAKCESGGVQSARNKQTQDPVGWASPVKSAYKCDEAGDGVVYVRIAGVWTTASETRVVHRRSFNDLGLSDPLLIMSEVPDPLRWIQQVARGGYQGSEAL